MEPTYLPSGHLETLYELLDFPDLDVAVGGGLLVRHRCGCAWGRVVATLRRVGARDAENLIAATRALVRPKVDVEDDDDDNDEGEWSRKCGPRRRRGIGSCHRFLSVKITVGELSVVRKYRTDPVHTGLCQPRRNVVDIAIHSGAVARSVRSFSFFLVFSFSFSLTLGVARAGIKRSSLSTRRTATFARGYYTIYLPSSHSLQRIVTV